LLIADIVMYGGGCGEVPGNSASKESRVGDPAPHQREIWVQEESRVGDPAPHNLETKKAGSETRHHTISKQRKPGRRPGSTPGFTPLPLWDRVFVGPGLCGTGSLTRSGGNQSTGSGPFHSHR